MMKTVNGNRLAIAATTCVIASAAPLTGVAAEIEEVVVSGIRGSLATSIEQKREAAQIVDTISARDIGKLPDENVAESIQRVTGVQISRSRGEGLGVNIRGLSAQTTINGRVGLGSRTDDIAARDFDFRNLAADFFQTVEVFKSPIAAQAEGGLGGTVNLVTRKPLDLRKRTISLGAEAQYGDFRKKVDPRVSAFFADQYLDDTLGIAIGASYSQRSLRADFFQALGGWTVSNIGTATGFDLNRDGTSNDVLRPVDLRFRTANDERTRYGADVTLQWKPADDLELRIDATVTRYENIIRNHFFRTLSTNPTSFVPGSLRIDGSGNLLGGTFTNQRVEIDGRYEPEPIDSNSIGGNLKWHSGGLTLEGDASVAQTDRKLLSQFLRFEGLTPATVAFNFRGNETPPTLALTTAAGAPYDLLSPQLFIPNLAQDRVITSDAKEYATKFDATYELERGMLSAVRGGVRATWRDLGFRVRTSANQATNTSNPSFYDQTTGRRYTIADSPLNQFAGSFPFSNGLFPDFDGALPRGWLSGRYDEGDADVGSSQYLTSLRIRDFGGLLNSNAEQSDISEDTQAAYVMADLRGELFAVPVRGNVGLRFVRTELTSAGLLTLNGVVSPVSIDNNYNDTLPSANFSFDLSDKLKLRLALAKVIERPDIGQLATGYNINLSSGVASSGNPLLDPFRANQFDASLEYYTSDEGLISLAAFFKDVSNFVDSRTFTGQIPGVTRLDGGSDFLITAPFNGGGATIRGFEFGFQQPLTFLPEAWQGFGVVANYTYSDVDTDSGRPIRRLSRDAVNLIGYFERGAVSTRLAYNWRSKFALDGEGGNAAQTIGLFEYVASAGYLDASLSYDFSDRITVVLEGANLLGTKDIRYLDTPTRLRDISENDRRFTLGARVRF